MHASIALLLSIVQAGAGAEAATAAAVRADANARNAPRERVSETPHDNVAPPVARQRVNPKPSSRQYVLRYTPRNAGGTPLVVVLEADQQTALERALNMAATNGGKTFPFVPGRPLETAWPTEAWLARDLDGTGCVESGRELFGSTTTDVDGAPFPHGFAALQALDDNGDGMIDENDAAYPTLALWRDNGDRRCEAAEMLALTAARITTLHTTFADARQCAPGVCAREVGALRFTDADGQLRRGALVDLHFTRVSPVKKLASTPADETHSFKARSRMR